MPRILVLHVSAGTGHTSAARALGEAFARTPGVDVTVQDVFDHINTPVKNTIQKGYNEISTRAQPLYSMLHSSINIGNPDDALSANRLMATLGRPFLIRFERYVAELRPDAIISTMQIPFHVLKAYEASAGVPGYAVITDFSVQSSWLREGVAGYFVASDLTRHILLGRNIPPEIVHVTGIPVKLEIAEPKDPGVVRAARNLPLDLPLITVFGGGVAVDRIRSLIEQLIASDKPSVVTAIAGRNDQLMDALSDLGDGPKVKLIKLGFIDYVDDLVAASDIVITKPGGLITSEVLARGAPIIAIDPIPGQEEWNSDVICGTGAGLQIRMPELVPPAVRMLLENPQRLADMRRYAQQVGHPRAALEVAEIVLAHLAKRDANAV
jgi:processive 1,2-diacylglycerol beta-glucosyltransferase